MKTTEAEPRSSVDSYRIFGSKPRLLSVPATLAKEAALLMDAAVLFMNLCTLNQ
jgi:hypothetical protein